MNKIANGLTQNEFDELINDDDKPFFDRAAQGRYSPASTIKPAIGLFGIDKDILDWEYTIQDPGFFILPEDGRIYRGWKKGGHGEINLKDAIIESSNTFFFSLAYQTLHPCHCILSELQFHLLVLLVVSAIHLLQPLCASVEMLALRDSYNKSGFGLT
mgnify:CR=1 FL=1